MSKVSAYILGALLGSLAFSFKNIGYILQKKAGNTILVRGDKRGLLAYLTNITWIIGWIFPFLGGSLLVVAYMFAPVSFVMPFAGVGLVVLIFFSRFYLKEKIHTIEWVAILLITGSIVLIASGTTGIIPEPGGPDEKSNIHNLLAGFLKPGSGLFLLLSLSGIFLLTWLSSVKKWKVTEMLWGLFAGTLGGTALIIQKPFALVLKVLQMQPQIIFVFILCGLLMVFFSIAAVVALNVGYKYGKGVIIASVYSSGQMVFPILGGIIIFHEWQGMDFSAIWKQCTGLLCLIVAMVLPSLFGRKKSAKAASARLSHSPGRGL